MATMAEQFQEQLSHALEQGAQRRALFHQWQNASPGLLAELVRLADRADLASCLEGAPVALIARILAIEPKLAEVSPAYPAPVDKLALLWATVRRGKE